MAVKSCGALSGTSLMNEKFKESPYFTVMIHHEVIMFTKPNNLVYEHGGVDYMDYVHSSSLNRQLLDKLVESVGLDLPMGFLYKKQKFSLLEGLVSIRSDIDIATLLKDRNGATEVDIYLVPPSQTYELEWDWSIPIPHRPPSPENSNVRKGLVIIDPETREELFRLDPFKLQCKDKKTRGR
ncbi:uncharacterized protein Fot_10563 [Forsythia ovata]|uniref:PB1-like domain-containing protein n=1 Tax=Forsythia ovata TaxID=205694 RepID=A0ABD1WK06_9LAMI